MPQTRQITTGVGLNGGGDLSGDRALSITFGATSGTVAAGDDVRFSMALSKTMINAKGDLVAGMADDTPSRLPVGSDGQVLVADSSSSVGISWATQSAIGNSATFPLSGYGLVAATDNPQVFSRTSIVSPGDVFLTRLFVPPNTAFSQIALAVGIGDSTFDAGDPTPNRLGLYDDNGVLLQATPDDSTMWSTTNSWYVGTLPTSVAAQASGRFVYVAFIVGGFNAASPVWSVSADIDVIAKAVGINRRRTMFVNSQTALPASFDPTAFGTLSNYTPLIGLL